MLKTKILLLSSAVPAGAWSVSSHWERWLPAMQVIAAILFSLAIFLAILRATENRHLAPRRFSRRTRATSMSTTP